MNLVDRAEQLIESKIEDNTYEMLQRCGFDVLQNALDFGKPIFPARKKIVQKVYDASNIDAEYFEDDDMIADFREHDDVIFQYYGKKIVLGYDEESESTLMVFQYKIGESSFTLSFPEEEEEDYGRIAEALLFSK